MVFTILLFICLSLGTALQLSVAQVAGPTGPVGFTLSMGILSQAAAWLWPLSGLAIAIS